MIRAIFFDIGETLVDRTRKWAAWAEAAGLPPHTFSALYGASIVTATDLTEWTGALPAQINEPPVEERDLYPDARGTLAELRAAGLFVGVAGNQPAAVGGQLRSLDLPADVVAASDEWGLQKPDPAFFARCLDEAGCRAEECVYVGDQLQLDIAAALAAGLPAIWLRRGPHGLLRRDPALEGRCLGVIRELRDLARLVV